MLIFPFFDDDDLFFPFIFVVSINSFEPVCVCSLSFSWWFSLDALLSLWVVDWWSRGSGWVGGAGQGRGFARRPVVSGLGDLMLCDRLAVQSDPLSPLYAAVVTLFEAALFSCVVAMRQARRLLFDFDFISEKTNLFIRCLAPFVCACLRGKGILHLSKQCGFCSPHSFTVNGSKCDNVAARLRVVLDRTRLSETSGQRTARIIPTCPLKTKI